MSLFRQLWLAVAFSTAMAFIGSFAVSMVTARNYLEQQLQTKNSDNASALALSLSQQKIDQITVELFVSALFDSGHYELIRVADPFGKVLSERSGQAASKDVPDWFVHLFPIRAHPGSAQISNGWNQVGTITLISHSRFAYGALWRGAMEMLGWFAIAGLVSGLLGSLILRRLHQPLQNVVAQARAISERRFMSISEPRVPELRQLAGAMNAMVKRLKAMFDEEAARLESVRREANHDALTGLANRAYFLGRLQEAVKGEDAAPEGTLLLIRIRDLAGINRSLGREAADQLLVRVAGTIEKCLGTHSESLAARLNGADFAALIPNLSDGRDMADELLRRTASEATAFVVNERAMLVAFIRYTHGREVGSLLAQVDAALAAAESLESDIAYKAEDVALPQHPVSAEEWFRRLNEAVNKGRLRLVEFPVHDCHGKLLHRECPLRLSLQDDGDWLPAGRFMPMAARLQITAQLDLASVRLALEQLAREAAYPDLAVNIAGESIRDVQFQQQLKALLSRYSLQAGRLWVEIAEHGAFQNFDAFLTVCGLLRTFNCRLGVEHFGYQFSRIGQLHDLGLDYLKVDSSFVRNIEASPGNRTFLEGLCAIAHNIDLLVIAEGVTSSAELDALCSLGFDGLTGPAVTDRA